MSVHITEAELRIALGTNFSDAAKGTETDAIVTIIGWGSALVDGALINAGYTPPSTSAGNESSAPNLVKMATIGAVATMMFGKNGLKLPAELNVFGNTFTALATGDLPIPDLTPNAANAVGGVAFTESDEDVSGSKPKVFGTLREDM